MDYVFQKVASFGKGEGLGQEMAGAGGGYEGVVLGEGAGGKDELDGRVAADEGVGNGDAVETGHHDVHEHNVGMETVVGGEDIEAAGGDGADFVAGFGEVLGEGGGEHALVIRKEDAHQRGGFKFRFKFRFKYTLARD